MSRSLFDYQQPEHVPADHEEAVEFHVARRLGAKFQDAVLFGRIARAAREGRFLHVSGYWREMGRVERLHDRGLVRIVDNLVIPAGQKLLKAVG